MWWWGRSLQMCRSPRFPANKPHCLGCLCLWSLPLHNSEDPAPSGCTTMTVWDRRLVVVKRCTSTSHCRAAASAFFLILRFSSLSSPPMLWFQRNLIDPVKILCLTPAMRREAEEAGSEKLLQSLLSCSCSETHDGTGQRGKTSHKVNAVSTFRSQPCCSRTWSCEMGSKLRSCNHLLKTAVRTKENQTHQYAGAPPFEA